MDVAPRELTLKSLLAAGLLAAVFCGLGAMAACGGSANTGAQGDTGSGPRLDASSDGAAMCGNTPRNLVDYRADVPDAGGNFVGVEVPDIAINATHLFYVLNWDKGIAHGGPDGALMGIPIRGGKAVRLASIPGGGSATSQAVAVSTTAAIFSQGPTADAGAGSILSVPAEGGGAPTVVATTSGRADALIADAENVYFVDREGTKTVPLAGGLIRTLATKTPYSLGIVGRTLYLGDYGYTNTLSSVSVDGGPVTVLATDPDGVLYPIGCGSDLCWVSGPPLGASLKRLVPGATPSVVASGFLEPLDLLFDGKNFFVSKSGGGLLRVPAVGGTPFVMLLPGPVAGLAMDEMCLYWSAASGIYSMSRAAADTFGSDGG